MKITVDANGLVRAVVRDDGKQARVAVDLLDRPRSRRGVQARLGGVAFSHALEAQIGGQLQAGFVLTHFSEEKGAGRCFNEALARQAGLPRDPCFEIVTFHA